MKKITFLFLIVSIFVSCKEEDKNNFVDAAKTQIITSKLIAPEQLKGKTTEELRLVRNEIFARKGYVFKDSTLNNYFSNKEWYKPIENIEITLTDLEKQNIELIKSFETE